MSKGVTYIPEVFLERKCGNAVLWEEIMNKFRRFYRRIKSSVLCVVFYIVVINVVCLYYLTNSPSPWMSQHGPFFLDNMRGSQYSCKPVKLSPHPLRLTALASFPGSGNTWVRHLIQQATGIATGSVYNDVVLRQHGFPGEGIKDGRVSIIKTHEWGEEHRKNFSRAVLLVRDPYACLLAEFNRQNGGHRGHALPHDFQKDWSAFEVFQSRGWLDMHNDWLKFGGPLLIMLYKDLKNDPLKETRRLLDFLDLKVTNADLRCMMGNSQGKFKRKKSPLGRGINQFSPFVKTTIDNYIENVTKEIQNYYKSKIS